MCRPRPWSRRRPAQEAQPLRAAAVASPPAPVAIKNRRSNAPRSFRAQRLTAPPPCGTCNGARPCETTAPAAALRHFVRDDRRHHERSHAQIEAMRALRRAHLLVLRAKGRNAMRLLRYPSRTCRGAALADMQPTDTHHTVEIAHPVAVSHPCEWKG